MTNDRFLQELRGILQPAMRTLEESLSAALNRTTRVQLGDIRPVELEELGAGFPDQVVLTHAAFVAELSHDLIYLAATREAALWGDLMIKGEGGAEFSAAEHLDAHTELLNQISGALGQYLSSAAGFPIQIRAGQAKLETINTQAEALESYFRIDLNVRTEGLEAAPLLLLVSPEAVQDLQKIQSVKQKAMNDRPPPAVLDEELDLDDTPEVRSARFEDFGAAAESPKSASKNIDILMDLELPVIIELGRTSMFIRDILELGPGSIVELSKLSGEPVDLFVNDKKFAQGEVVVIDENFGIRITDLMKVEDRIRSLK